MNIKQIRMNFAGARAKKSQAFRLSRANSSMLGIVNMPGTGLVPEILKRLQKKLQGHSGGRRPVSTRLTSSSISQT